MAEESTSVAVASHQDNRSLRIIQIMSMIFLPASFVSGIFGMGFFSTSTGNHDEPVFVVSHNWWLYLAVAVPLTALVLVFVALYQARENGKKSNPGVSRRTSSLSTMSAPRDVEWQAELKKD